MRTILALVCIALLAAPAQAAPTRSNRISVSYLPPTNPEHRPIYRQLKEIRFLEQLRRFLSPLRLPRTLQVKTQGCNGEVNAWYDDAVVTICYEYVAEIWKTAPTEITMLGATPLDALVGPVFDTCLHEVAHALFDMLRLPVFGREEDAADQVAAYVTLQLGRAEARRVITGTAYAYMTEANTAPALTLQQYANVHGTPAQRFYNLLCIAYGADPKTFGDLVENGFLPKERADGCADEYRQITFAFERLIAPHIDPRRARKVLDRSWLPDTAVSLPRRP